MNEVEIDEEYDGSRNVYIEPETRALIRTKDVYQTELDNGVNGYSKTLLAIVANFTNGGKPEGYNVQAMVGRSKRGEVALRMFAVVDDSAADPVFVKAGFQVRGCVAMVGCASVACTMIEGRAFSQALRITQDDIERAVDGLTPDRRYTAMFAAECIKALVGDWMYRTGMSLDAMNDYLGCDEGSVTCLLCEHCSLRAARTDMRVAQAMVENAAAGAGEDAQSAAPSDDELAADAAVEGAAVADKAAAVATPGALADAGTALVQDAPTEGPAEPQDPEAEARACAENNALATVFDMVRKASSDSELTTRETWEAAGLVPEHLTPDEFAEMVFSYLEQWKQDHAQELQQEKEEREARKRSVRSATRAVGVPPKIPNRRLAQIEADQAAEAEVPSSEDAGEATEPAEPVAEAAAAQDAPTGEATQGAPAEEAIQPQDAVSTGDESYSATAIEAPAADVVADDDPWASLDIPDGYKPMEIDGEIVLVEDPDAKPKCKEINCAHVEVLEGLTGKYLFDADAMTNNYAHWAFLAKEDNPAVTFAECVREDSRVYPRPYKADNFKNPPFSMSDEDIEQAWELVSASEAYTDIERTSASNGDVYFYSTKYLSARYAHSLAEYASVDRQRNV